jgi:hypothetical protein
MGDLKRVLENTSVVFVLLLSAPLAALLFSVLLIYLYIVAVPSASGGTGELRDLFAMFYVIVYLTICFFAIKGN